MRVSKVIRLVKNVHCDAKVKRHFYGQEVVGAVITTAHDKMQYNLRGEMDGSVTVELFIGNRLSTTRSIVKAQDFHDLVDVNVTRHMNKLPSPEELS